MIAIAASVGFHSSTDANGIGGRGDAGDIGEVKGIAGKSAGVVDQAVWNAGPENPAERVRPAERPPRATATARFRLLWYATRVRQMHPSFHEQLGEYTFCFILIAGYFVLFVWRDYFWRVVWKMVRACNVRSRRCDS